MSTRTLFSVTLHLVSFLLSSCRLTESERVAQWRERGNIWPPNWHQESESYKAHQSALELEIMQLPGTQERWQNWMQFTQGQLVPKFTPRGFEVIATPSAVHAKLLKSVSKELENWDSIPLENFSGTGIYVREGPKEEVQPKFVNLGSVAWDVILDLQHFHEEWVGGIKLRPTSAYGVRFYQNGSSLMMHHDKTQTHVISSIVHIAHQYDNESEPWPIQIEDHDGVLHSVSLKPGQMLFYESAKCLHGRMTEFKGKYYGSIFLHYEPVDKNIWNYTLEDVINNVPPHWKDGVVEAEGSRDIGQGIVVDSLAAAGSPPRIVQGVFIHNNVSPNAYLGNLTIETFETTAPEADAMEEKGEEEPVAATATDSGAADDASAAMEISSDGDDEEL